jgi:hypothetical protein
MVGRALRLIKALAPESRPLLSYFSIPIAFPKVLGKTGNFPGDRPSGGVT